MLLDNRYEVVSKLSEGGFGETFLAEDTRSPTRRRCVVKRLKSIFDPSQYQLIKERFEREAVVLEQLAELTNQIPKMYAYFVEANNFYLVQEWINGETLAQKLGKNKRMPEIDVIEIVDSSLLVLHCVHSQRVVHRDIKPDNIIIRSKDNQCVLIDFGVIKEMASTAITTASTSIVAGTQDYMPIEQMMGKPIFASDIYGLAMTAIHLLTGMRPQELYNPMTAEVDWRKHASGVTSSFAMILDKAAQRIARDRYASVEEMREALQKVRKLKSTRVEVVDVPRSQKANQQIATPLFPLYGVTLGKTTKKELARLGDRSHHIDEETGQPYTSYIIRGLSFWYDEDSGICESIFMTAPDEDDEEVGDDDVMPVQWETLGFSWQLSYEGWVNLLQRLGYDVVVVKEPSTEIYDGYQSFMAKIMATNAHAEIPIEIRLCFQYSRGTKVTSLGTLFSFDVSVKM